MMDNVWNDIHGSRIWGEYPESAVIRFIARNYYHCSQRDKIRILDFGCGAGAHTWYLAREGFDTYAFDGAKSAVDNTIKKLESMHLSAHVTVQDGTKIDYEKNYFDCVVDSACIYANKKDDITTMYENIYNVLKPSGKLLTICFGEELDGYRTGREIEQGTYCDIRQGALSNRGIAHIFTPEELTELLQHIGFCNIRYDTVKYTDEGSMVHQYIFNAEK